MPGWFVSANDIVQWTNTNRIQAASLLPQLIKRLIIASTNIIQIDFPSGDSISENGWDGFVEVEKGNEFIPSGISGWELSTDQRVGEKANKDFAKRSDNPISINPVVSTYVSVTSRMWNKKAKWVEEKRNLGIWKDVRSLNANSIASWLEKCPAVHRWFANQIGKRTNDLWDLDQVWNSFSNSTGVPLIKEFFLKSRNDKTEKFISALDSKHGNCINIKSQSVREYYGFILSALFSKEDYNSRALIVNNQETWDWLLDFKDSLILIPYYNFIN
jgi:hypothetical protein